MSGTATTGLIRTIPLRYLAESAIKQFERRAGNTTLNYGFHNCHSGSATFRASTTQNVMHPAGRMQGVRPVPRIETEEVRAKRLAQVAAYRAANREKILLGKAAYRAAHPEKVKAHSAAFRTANPGYLASWRLKNPDKVAAYRETNRVRMAREYREGLEKKAKHLESGRCYRAKKAELRALIPPKPKKSAEEINLARAAWQRARYHSDPKENLRRRMSAAIRGYVKHGKNGERSTWLVKVGYSIQELQAHLERQFLPKMGWHNMPKWHIDHIVPLSSFELETRDDPGFKAAWSLTNLRPIWKKENLSKHDRRVFLL